MSITPWEKVGESKTLAEGFGKKLVQQQFSDHKKRPVDFYFAEAPSWSVVLPITTEGNVLLVRQFKQGSESIEEELPGGTADFVGETPETIMRRELREETGFESETVVALGSGWANSRNAHTQFFCFLATGCKRMGDLSLDVEEQVEIIEIPLEEWIARAMKGELVGWDGCITTLRALPYLKKTLHW